MVGDYHLDPEVFMNLTAQFAHLRLAIQKRVSLISQQAATHRHAVFVDSVVDGQRSDGQILELLTAMNLGRLPTESERKLILASVSQQADKKAAWREVVWMLRSTEEAKRHAAELGEKR